MIRALYLLFVLSGAAGLIYESIWTRYLGLFVGHDAYAQIIVLVIFLGGMSAGALASQPAISPPRPTALWICRCRIRGGHHRTVFSRRLPDRNVMGLYLGLSRACRNVDAAGRQVGHRERTHPSPVGAARRHLPTDVAPACCASIVVHPDARSPCSTSPTVSAPPPAFSSRVSTSCRWPASPARSSRAAMLNLVVAGGDGRCDRRRSDARCARAPVLRRQARRAGPATRATASTAAALDQPRDRGCLLHL